MRTEQRDPLQPSLAPRETMKRCDRVIGEIERCSGVIGVIIIVIIRVLKRFFE